MKLKLIKLIRIDDIFSHVLKMHIVIAVIVNNYARYRIANQKNIIKQLCIYFYDEMLTFL